MTMNKKRMARMIQLADSVLSECRILKHGKNGPFIEDAYNGQTAGFGVTVAMSGLLPALVIYYQQAGESCKINRKNILEAIARMIHQDQEFENRERISNADSLLAAAIESPASKALRKEVIDCAIALKQTIRTYKLEKDEES